jgi:3-oxoacyl-[acyl-carrier protein] reductase
VIGGSGTLGQVLCTELAAQGAQVGLTYLHNEQAARMLSERCGALAARLDVSGDALAPGLDGLADRLGGIDAVVYAAAVASTQTPASFDALEDVQPSGWDQLFAVNVRGPFFAAQWAARRMAASGGNLVFIGSIDGVKPMPAPVPYAASKGALGAMASALAKALGKSNIRVNVVAPGVLSAGASRTLPEDLRAEYLRHTALKRYGTLQEAARVIAHFALRNTYVTAQTIALDGGL